MSAVVGQIAEHDSVGSGLEAAAKLSTEARDMFEDVGWVDACPHTLRLYASMRMRRR